MIDKVEPIPLAIRLRAMKQLAIPVWVFDIDHACIVWANEEALTVWSSESLEELYSRDMGADMSPTVARRLRQYQEAFNHGERFIETWTLYPKGIPKTYDCHFSGIILDDGRVAMLCQALSSVTQVNGETLHGLQALLHTPVMITLYSKDGRQLYSNPAARAMLGSYQGGLRDHLYERASYDQLEKALSSSEECRLEERVHTVNGVRWHELQCQRSPDAVTGEPSLLVSEIDITERRRAEEKIHELAYHDSLTCLPNRSSLLSQLEREIKYAKRYNKNLAVLFLDMDRFKTINDSLGHAVGDQFLIQVARQLRACVYETDIVARLGGDEFVVVLTNVTSPDAAALASQRIIDGLSTAYQINGYELHSTPSIGISTFPIDGTSCEALMKNADVAMYQSKAKTGGAFTFFDCSMNHQANERLRLENELRKAIRRNEFVLHYQPKVSISDGCVEGVEALIRWQHPERGLLSPYHFIDVAEETGMIRSIGHWVLQEALRQHNQWAEKGTYLSIAVNISARQFALGNLYSVVEEALHDACVDARYLELEITESVLMGDQQSTLETLRQLHDIGIKLSVDDFGTGYSNLGYLHQFPIDNLKIDRAFVQDLERPAILKMILSMGQMMDLNVIAEGVEEIEQLEWLKANGCDEYQGYYFSPAVPADDLLPLIQRQ